MEIKKIFIANDHAGFEAKIYAKSCLVNSGFEVVDLGAFDAENKVDYPDFARALCEKMRDEPNSYGVLICGTGIGISIAANRYEFVRCALCKDTNDARLAREHNDANIIAFGGRTTQNAMIKDMLEVFFATEFSGGRHEKRVEKLGKINVC